MIVPRKVKFESRALENYTSRGAARALHIKLFRNS